MFEEPVGRVARPGDHSTVESDIIDDAGTGGRPGWLRLLLAGAVLLVVGGYALSRDYGVPNVSNPSDNEEITAPLPLSIPTSSTVVTAVHQSVEPSAVGWPSEVVDVAASPDGYVYAVSPTGVAQLYDVDDWALLDVDALPTNSGPGGEPTGRSITQVEAGPESDVWSGIWFAGFSTPYEEDEEFGGILDGSTGRRVLDWVARFHCPICGEWTVWTSDQMPELAGGVGDLAVSAAGLVYAAVGDDRLMVYDGSSWTSHQVPLPAVGETGVRAPWSGSLAVGTDEVVWSASNYDSGGVLSFDGVGFTRYGTDDGLPDDAVTLVAAAGDGTIWAATERSGVARFDGASWTTYTVADGLLSNRAVIAAGEDGTVWAIHTGGSPFGYSRFDGSGWVTYPFAFDVSAHRADVDADGTLWTISDDGLASFDGLARTRHPSPFMDAPAVTPLQWEIAPEDDSMWGPGVYTLYMVLDVRPIDSGRIENLLGTLIWNEASVGLCGMNIRARGRSHAHLGDIFQTVEGCGIDPNAMQNAFNQFGLPRAGCLAFTFGGIDYEYCAPLERST